MKAGFISTLELTGGIICDLGLVPFRRGRAANEREGEGEKNGKQRGIETWSSDVALKDAVNAFTRLPHLTVLAPARGQRLLLWLYPIRRY